MTTRRVVLERLGWESSSRMTTLRTEFQDLIDTDEMRRHIKTKIDQLKSPLPNTSKTKTTSSTKQESGIIEVLSSVRTRLEKLYLTKRTKLDSIGVFSSHQNSVRCSAAMKLAFQKAMKNPKNLNLTMTPEEVNPSFNCNTTIGRIEQMCVDLLRNKDPTELLKITQMQDSLSGTPSLLDFEQQLTDSSDGEFWDEVDAQQEAKLLRYHEFIDERKKLFPELYITDNIQTKEASNEESCNTLNTSESEVKTFQEAKEQLKRAALQIEELYKAKDVEIKEAASSSGAASNIETASTIQRDYVLHQDPCLDHGSTLEDLLSSPEAQELTDLIPVLPEFSTIGGNLEQEVEDSGFQNRIIAARIERIWFILQMSIEDKIKMVLELIREANLGDINETLILWELAAAAVLHREHLLLQLQDLRITIEDNKCSLEVLSLSRELCLGLIFATRHVKRISEKLTNGVKVAGLSYPPNQALTESDVIKFYLWCNNNNKQNTLNNTMY